MISKTSRGRGFRGALDYVLRESKDAEIVATNMAGQTPRELAKEFGTVRCKTEKVREPVWLVSLSAPPGEQISNERWGLIATRFIELVGAQAQDGEVPISPERNQFVAVRHYDTEVRADGSPGHPHIHIILNRINLDDKTCYINWEKNHSRKACRQIEREFELTLFADLTPEQEEAKKQQQRDDKRAARRLKVAGLPLPVHLRRPRPLTTQDIGRLKRQGRLESDGFRPRRINAPATTGAGTDSADRAGHPAAIVEEVFERTARTAEPTHHRPGAGEGADTGTDDSSDRDTGFTGHESIGERGMSSTMGFPGEATAGDLRRSEDTPGAGQRVQGTRGPDANREPDPSLSSRSTGPAVPGVGDVPAENDSAPHRQDPRPSEGTRSIQDPVRGGAEGGIPRTVQGQELDPIQCIMLEKAASTVADFMNQEKLKFVDGQEYTFSLEGPKLTVIRKQDQQIAVQAEFKDDRWQAVAGEVSLGFIHRSIAGIRKHQEQQQQQQQPRQPKARPKPASSKDQER